MNHINKQFLRLLEVSVFALFIIGNVSCAEQYMQKNSYDAYEKIITKCLESSGEQESGSKSGRIYGKASFTFNLKNKTIRVEYGYIPLDNYIENLLIENYEWYTETGTLSDMSIEEECGLKDSTKFYPVSIQGIWNSDKAGDGNLVVSLSTNNDLIIYIFGENWKHWKSFHLDTSEVEFVLGVLNEARERLAHKEHRAFSPVEISPLSLFGNQWEYEQQSAIAASHGLRYYCKEGKIGLINKNAVEVIPAIYSRIELSDDGQYVKVWDEDKAGIMTIEGETVLPIIYSDIMPLSFANLEKGDSMGDVFVPGDPYVVVYKGDKKGVANRDGKIICEVKYDSINWYDKLYCLNNNGLDIIDIHTHETIHVDCESAWISDGGGYVTIKRNNKWGIINDSGAILVDTIYDDIPSQEEGDCPCLLSGDGNRIAVVKDGKYGIIDLNGRVCVPFEYDEIESIPYGGYRRLFKGRINKDTWEHIGVWGVYKNGSIIVPCTFPDKITIDEYISQGIEEEIITAIDTTAFSTSNDSLQYSIQEELQEMIDH